MRRCLFILGILFVFVLPSFGQNQQILSYQSWLDEMAQCEDPVYILDNAIIRYDPSTDRRFIDDDSVYRSGLDSIRVKSQVILKDVIFEKTDLPNTFNPERSEANFCGLFRVIFDSKVELHQTNGLCHLIEQCTFKAPVTIDNSTGNNLLQAIRSTFKNNIIIQNNKGKVIFYQSSLDSNLTVSSSQLEQLFMVENQINSTINLNDLNVDYAYVYDNVFSNTLFHHDKEATILRITGSEFDKCRLGYNTFNNYSQNQIIRIGATKCSGYFGFYNNTTDTRILFVDCVNTGRFTISENISSSTYAFHNLQFSTDNSYFGWPSLKGKIVGFVWSEAQLNFNIEAQFVTGFEEDILSNEIVWNRILITKQNIYNLYRKQGLIVYANELFVEIKDLETARYATLYRQSPNWSSYLNWKLNLFLRSFSDYGTNLVKAINYALKVIFIFSIIYFLFYNDWDIISRKKIDKKLRLYLHYFSRKDSMAQLLEEEIKEERRALHEFKETLLLSASQPRLFRWIAHLHYSLSQKWLSASIWSRSVSDVLKGRWEDLPKSKKRKASWFITLRFFLFLVYGLVVKSLNSIILSINAFTTLGFGAIPTRGVARYVVIIQGMIGWILMTLFSVTLITQLLR